MYNNTVNYGQNEYYDILNGYRKILRFLSNHENNRGSWKPVKLGEFGKKYCTEIKKIGHEMTPKPNTSSDSTVEAFEIPIFKILTTNAVLRNSS